MNSRSYHRPFEPWGLYTPKGRQCASEDILCSDRIGIALVAASDTQKILSTAIQRIAPSTTRACSGSIGRVHSNKQNTVLLGFVSDSVEHSPIEPGCNGFAKCLASVFVLSETSGRTRTCDLTAAWNRGYTGCAL